MLSKSIPSISLHIVNPSFICLEIFSSDYSKIDAEYGQYDLENDIKISIKFILKFNTKNLNNLVKMKMNEYLFPTKIMIYRAF